MSIVNIGGMLLDLKTVSFIAMKNDKDLLIGFHESKPITINCSNKERLNETFNKIDEVMNNIS